MAQVTIRIPCATRAEAEQAKVRVLRQYHPCGYGTVVEIVRQAGGDGWLVIGSRYHSCD